ncbi:hypothetical protein CBR_g3960 [Chara braunii]|uniref:RNA-directed DNA polymerase n=1 Tax=Chara braunii TaxID=69332 RepID=A0A388KGU2_CHABU|nr:hypothetical protein CBR_g3960 [Chara braunii]|eukprot:GBG69262.1 hypothetical protein CBR_g3960 [Chara braunii]
MPEEMADGGRKLVTLDDLIDALDKRERASSNVPKVDTFHFKGERVSDWLDLTEQALVGLSDEVKLQRVLRYVLHSHHQEVGKVMDTANGSWARFRDMMQRKYRLGDGLLTMADLEAMNKDDFSTIGVFVHEFKRKARKVHGISEETQCAIFWGLLTGSEASELTGHGGGSEKLTWATIDKGVEDGSLDQVEQHQVRLQRRKRKERDATSSGTPGVKRVVTDVLATLGYDNEAEVQKRGVTVTQGRASGAVEEEARREDYGGEETDSQILTKAQRKQRNLQVGGQGSGKGQVPQVIVASPPAATTTSATSGPSCMGPPPACGHWVPHCQPASWPSCKHCTSCGGSQTQPRQMVPYAGPAASMGPPNYPTAQGQFVAQPPPSQQASQVSVVGGGNQGQGGQGNGGRGQGGRGGGGRGRGGNGGGRGGGWNGQGGQNQSGRGGQEGGQGYGRPRFDWRNATCWHCSEVGHTIRFCQRRRDDELADLISSCMDGDIYDKWGEHIDPRTPGGIRQEALRRAAAGPSTTPTMFRMWQEKEELAIKVEEIVGDSEEVTQRLKAGTIREEPIVVESDDEGQGGEGETTTLLLGRMEDLLEKVGRYQRKLQALCEEAREWEANLTEVFLYDSGPEPSPGQQGCRRVATVETGPRSGMTYRPPTSHGRVPQAARTRSQNKAGPSQEPSQAPSQAPPRKEPEPRRRKEVVEVPEEEEEDDDEEDERLRQEEDQRAELRVKKRGAQEEAEPSLPDSVPKRKKYAAQMEEGFDVEWMVDKLLEGHNNLMNLKGILTSAPRLRGELKGRLSRRLVPNVHPSTVDLVIRNQKCTGMVDTGAEMNIIREKEAVMIGMEIDRSDHGMLHGANCKAAFCGTASNVIIEIGKVRAGTCLFIMPDVDHPILLGRSFLCQTKMLIFNKHDGTMILLLCDSACGNYEVITCRNTGPGSGRNRPNLGSFTFEESENERRRLWEVPEEEDRAEVLTLSLTDVNKAMEVVSAYDMADPEAIKALREQVLENPQDLQRLDAVTVRDAAGLPNADALSESCAGRPIISLIDLYSGYDQFPVYLPDRPVTAMHTPRGLIHMNVAPQGWTNAMAMVQRHIIRAMQTVNPHITQPYIDDLAVKGPKEKEEDEVMSCVRRFVWKHVQDIDQVLGLLEEHNLTASGPKSKHCMREATILGFVCNESGRRSDVKKTNKILEWPVPFRLVTNVRSFLGTCGFWRSFVKDFATKTEHLRKLVRQDQEWVWGEDQEEAVGRMKGEFKEGGLVLGVPNYEATEERPFVIETDVGPTALGGILIQADTEGKERPLRFESRTLNTTERNFSQFKKETLAVLHCIRTFWNYVFGRTFILRVDPTALACSLKNYTPSDPTVARWLTYIWMFNFELERIPGNKNRADGLSRINWDGSDEESIEDTPLVMGFWIKRRTSDFSKTAMQRGGRGARPRQRPQGASGGADSHRPVGKESTPIFDDGNIELFLDSYQAHATREGWSTLERLRHLRGVGRFEEPIARIREEALTWQDVEARMQTVRASPLGPDGLPIRLEEGNAEEFIPAYEQYMRDQGAGPEEWMQTLPLWTRRAERPLAGQIRDRARDWEDCQAQLRQVFRRLEPERPEPRVERRQRSMELYQEKVRMEAAGEAPKPPIDPPASEQRISEAWASYEGERDAARLRLREAGQENARVGEARETEDLGFSAAIMEIERTDRRIETPQQEGMRKVFLDPTEAAARREVEERRFNFRTPTKLASQQATAMTIEVPGGETAQRPQPPVAEGDPTEESPTILLEVQEGALTGAAASTEQEVMRGEASRLDELVAAMELDMPSGGPQRLDTPERVPEIGELRTQLGSWATGADSGEHISEQQQEVMSESATAVTPLPSDLHRDEGATAMGGVREGRPLRLDTPAYRPEGDEVLSGPST